MILNHKQIIELVAAGAVQHADIQILNGSSLDVRLGAVFKPEVPSADVGADEWPVLDLGAKDPLTTERVEGPFVLEPGAFVLAATAERFDLPLDVSAEFRLKSSAGRVGLSHMLAVWCDPGWRGHLTLELHNVSRYHAIKLAPGDRIGQMIFHRHEAVARHMDYKVHGRYNDDIEPEGARRK